MFCCCAAGRLLLQIPLRQIDEIEYTFELLAAEATDYMGVFLLGTGGHPRSHAMVHQIPTPGFKQRSRVDTTLLSAFSGWVSASSCSVCTCLVLPLLALSHVSFFFNCPSPGRGYVTGCQNEKVLNDLSLRWIFVPQSSYSQALLSNAEQPMAGGMT